MKKRRLGCTEHREPRKTIRGSFSRGEKRRYGWKHRGKIVWKRSLLVLVLLAIFLYGTVRLIRYTVRSISTKQTNAEIAAVYEQQSMVTPKPAPATTPISLSCSTASPDSELLHSYQYIGNTLLSGAEELYAKNQDLVAWIRIPGIVNLPVVYRDNTYYLNHDFYGKENDSGTLFLDEAHPLWEDTQYLVVHGHAMYDGSMFGLITHYRKKSFAAEHTTVYFNTLYRKEEYEIFGILKLPDNVQDEGYVAYTGTRKFNNAEHFYSFVEKLRGNALYWKEDVDILPSDALLALSTCHDEERIVVMSKRISTIVKE